jgi:hypothetical protein
MSIRSNKVRRHLRRTLRKDRLTLSLNNDSSYEGSVLISAQGWDAWLWAKNDQSIAGSRWESAGSDYIYAMPSDHPKLVDELRKEGYKLDLTYYCFPEKEAQNE